MENNNKKTNIGVVILIIVLIAIIISLIVFILYDKIILKNKLANNGVTEQINNEASESLDKKTSLVGGYEYIKELEPLEDGTQVELVKQLILEENGNFVLASVVNTDSSSTGKYNVSGNKLILNVEIDMPSSGADCFTTAKTIEYSINLDGSLKSTTNETEILTKVDDISKLTVAQKGKLRNQNATGCLDENKLFTKSEIVGGYKLSEINSENITSITELLLEDDGTFTYAVATSTASGYTGTYELKDNKVILNATKNMYSSGMDCYYSDEVFEFNIDVYGNLVQKVNNESKSLSKVSDLSTLSTANKIKGISKNLSECSQ